MTVKIKNILLTGPPGCGKTLLIQEILQELKKVKAGGFFTSEIREKGKRLGFKIASLNGSEAILAHVNFKNPPRVSKYGVSIENLESIGLKALVEAREKADLIIIDEIGKMELFSQLLQYAILDALDSEKYVLGTIMQTPNPFADKIKKRKDTKIIEITRENRDEVLDRVIRHLIY